MKNITQACKFNPKIPFKSPTQPRYKSSTRSSRTVAMCYQQTKSPWRTYPPPPSHFFSQVSIKWSRHHYLRLMEKLELKVRFCLWKLIRVSSRIAPRFSNSRPVSSTTLGPIPVKSLMDAEYAARSIELTRIDSHTKSVTQILKVSNSTNSVEMAILIKNHRTSKIVLIVMMTKVIEICRKNQAILKNLSQLLQNLSSKSTLTSWNSLRMNKLRIRLTWNYQISSWKIMNKPKRIMMYNYKHQVYENTTEDFNTWLSNNHIEIS